MYSHEVAYAKNDDEFIISINLFETGESNPVKISREFMRCQGYF